MNASEQRRHIERMRNDARDLLDSDPLVEAEVRRTAQRIVQTAELLLDGMTRAPGPARRSGQQVPRDGSPEGAQYQRGLEHLERGEFDAAEVAFRESVRLNASNGAALLLLARTLLSNPRYERAGTLPVVRSLLDRAVLLAPDDDEAKHLREEIVREMG